MNSNFDLNTTGQHQTISPQQYMISQSAQDLPKFNGRAIKPASNTDIYPEIKTPTSNDSKSKNYRKISSADTAKQEKMLQLEMLRQLSGTQPFYPNSQNTDKYTNTKTTDDEKEVNNIEIGDVFDFNRSADKFSKQIKKALTQKDTDTTLAELSDTLNQLNNLKKHYLLDGNIDYLIQTCNHEINKITLNTIESSKSSNQPELSKEQKIRKLRRIQNDIQQLSHHSSIEDSEMLKRCDHQLNLLESQDQSSWCTII